MNYTTATRRIADQKKVAENFNLWLSENDSDEMVIYIDNSKKHDKIAKKVETRTVCKMKYKTQ